MNNQHLIDMSQKLHHNLQHLFNALDDKRIYDNDQNVIEITELKQNPNNGYSCYFSVNSSRLPLIFFGKDSDLKLLLADKVAIAIYVRNVLEKSKKYLT